MEILEFLGWVKPSANSLRAKATEAIDSFSKVMNDLREINEKSKQRQEELKEENLTIQKEIADLEVITLQNSKVISNIEKILK